MQCNTLRTVKNKLILQNSIFIRYIHFPYRLQYLKSQKNVWYNFPLFQPTPFNQPVGNRLAQKYNFNNKPIRLVNITIKHP